MIENTRGVDCPSIIDRNSLHDMLETEAIVYLQNEHGNAPPFSESNIDNAWVRDAIVWIWNGGGDPLLFNEWILSQGYGVFDNATAPKSIASTLEAAEEQAKDAGAGIWGECGSINLVELDTQPTPRPTPEGFVELMVGNGSETNSFEIPEDGNYTVTIGSANIQTYVETSFSISGDEVPELRQLVFGPDKVIVEVLLEAGSYTLVTQAVGTWSVQIYRA
jgi:hypothetical protein